MLQNLIKTLLLLLVSAPALAANGVALVIDIDGAIGPGTADYVDTSLKAAAERNASIVVLRMDTPGGLDRAMRDIVQDILASPVPVVGWVTPQGARADSAGTYILLACHVAAMSETSHLGAATPVSLIGDEDQPKPRSPDPLAEPETEEDDAEEDRAPDGGAMQRKVLNDAIAYIRSLAETHGRNADWAESAVRDAATLTAPEALEQNVIDLIANDLPGLLDAIDGRTVELDGEEAILATANIATETIEPTWRQKVLSTIASPEIAVLLMLIGIYGLMFEGWNPGSIVPGVIGAICLLLAAYALNVMPVNYAGLGLILLGFLLLIAEVFVPSFGALGLGGIASLIIGSIMLFNTGVPGFDISPWFVTSVAAFAGIATFALGYYAVKIMRRKSVAGVDLILHDTAVADESFESSGTVWLEGEQWQARSTVPIRAGQQLRILRVDGLVLDVEPIAETSESPQ